MSKLLSRSTAAATLFSATLLSGMLVSPSAHAAPLTLPQPNGTTGNPLANTPGGFSQLDPQAYEAALTIAQKLPATYDPDDPFYVPPATIPGQAGSLIRQAATPDLLGDVANDWPATATRLLFSSTTSDGKRVAASGVLMEPKSPWMGKGERPTFVIAPGTRGAGDVCAPSRSFNLLGGINSENLALGVNYEMPVAYLAAASGARVILTDYIGLGTPGPHTYVNHIEEGNAVLDATRAGLQASGAPADSPVGLWGYSQGGGASASAAERASTYAPELNIRGTYAGAPPADLFSVMESVDGNAIVGVLGMALGGLVDRYPRIQTEVIDPYFNEVGKRFIRETSEMCIPDAVLAWGGRSTRNFTTTGESLTELAHRLPAAGDALRTQQLGFKPLTAPMLVRSGVHDDTVPYPQARQMARDYCATGNQVTFVSDTLPRSVPGTAVNHAVPLFGGLAESLGFLFDRFNGVPVTSNCGKF
ncbi:lipase family protein [uncultured Corynebacterium sp.]|uniref:lipase family protein n=1 Tax=uncultured Corynebacterium sp. TaxID=159447 RepID=UPI002598D495|nr:lipase family protein [uncultured Corynebacterium sp.]